MIKTSTFALPMSLLSLALLSACGQQETRSSANTPSPTSESLPEVGVPAMNSTDMIVKSRALIEISTSPEVLASKLFRMILPNAYAASGTQSITIVNSASSTMTLSSVNFSIPAVSNVVLDFGSLGLASLFDNDLRVCGANGKQKCGKGVIAVYTTGQAGAGLWNDEHGYGAPLTVSGPSLSGFQDVALGSSSGIIAHQIKIAANKNVLRHGDFPGAVYGVKSDFTEAGAGSFSTTLVVDYGLMP